jgi:hypothetical protein
MRVVKEETNIPSPVSTTSLVKKRGSEGVAEGKTLTNRKNETAIIEADANVSRPQRYPEGAAAYVLTKPLVRVHNATAMEKSPK